MRGRHRFVLWGMDRPRKRALALTLLGWFAPGAGAMEEP
jgi:hypothetical protein